MSNIGDEPADGGSRFQAMRLLSDAEYEALEVDVAERGVMVPIEVDEEGNVLDGHHRLRIANELGVPCPKFERHGLSDQEKRTHARRLNDLRRHNTPEDRRQRIRAELLQDPARSDREIARFTGVSHPTVASVRRELEAGGKIYHQPERVGKDGVKQKISLRGADNLPGAGKMLRVEVETDPCWIGHVWPSATYGGCFNIVAIVEGEMRFTRRPVFADSVPATLRILLPLHDEADRLSCERERPEMQALLEGLIAEGA